MGEVHGGHVLVGFQDLLERFLDVLDEGVELGQLLVVYEENVRLSPVDEEHVWSQDVVEDGREGRLYPFKTLIQHHKLYSQMKKNNY